MAVTGQLDAAQLTVPWKVFDVALATTLVLTGFVAVALALGLMTRFTGLDRSTILTPWVLGALEGWMLAAVWAFGIRKYGVRWQALGFRRPNTSRRFLLPLVALTGSLVFTGIYAAIVTSVGIDYLRPPEFPADMLGQGFLRPLNALVIGLWVPFTEEVFFRGFLLAALVHSLGATRAALVSSALFAAAHFSLSTMIPIFVTGLLLAWLYLKTRSLWQPIAVHAAQNLIVVALVL